MGRKRGQALLTLPMYQSTSLGESSARPMIQEIAVSPSLRFASRLGDGSRQDVLASCNRVFQKIGRTVVVA